MFDTTAEFVIPARSGNARVEASVRWPNDEEWSERHKARKILIRRLGRGTSESEIDSTAADLALYEKVRVNGAPPLTAAEASWVVDIMARANVTGVVLEGDEAEVTLQVMGGTVTHRLQQPSADQVLKMRRKASRLFDAPYNQQQLRTYLEPTAQLWDECKGRSADYNGLIPALHKDAAVRAVIEQIEADLTAGDDEKLF
jgi:hypothetical protein